MEPRKHPLQKNFQPEYEQEKEKEHANDTDRPVSGGDIEEITTNDGSVIETLDTAFHGEPGWSQSENPSGSNRADYYEARSNGKTDSEEELDALREKNKEKNS